MELKERIQNKYEIIFDTVLDAEGYDAFPIGHFLEKLALDYPNLASDIEDCIYSYCEKEVKEEIENEVLENAD